MLLKTDNMSLIEKITTNRKIIITTSWDDGHPLDLKLAELLKEYNIPATFYIPVRNSEREHMSYSQIREIAKSFDIGGHTLNHLNLKKHIKEVEREIIEGKRRLEEIIDRNVTSFCYPQGAYNKEIVEVVKKAGFEGARTTHLFETRIKNPYEIGTTIHACDHSTFHYLKTFFTLSQNPNVNIFFFLLKKHISFENWSDLALATLDYVIENGGIWHLWGHSWEIEKHSDWYRLKKVFAYIKELKGELKNIIFLDNSSLLNYVYSITNSKKH